MLPHAQAAVALAAVLATSLAMPESARRPTAEPAVTRGPVTFTLTDYAFSGPDTIQPGMTTILTLNQGTVPHHMILGRLNEGKTMADVYAAITAGQDPTWLTWVGGGGSIAPGAGNITMSNLAPGHYVMFCFLQDAPQDPPHVAKGMVRGLVVAGEQSKELPPRATATVHLVDFAFGLPPLTAGRHLLRIVNDGKEPHEIFVLRIPAGSTFDDVMASFAPGGERLGTPMGGAGALSPGESNWWDIDLPAGNYAVLCFVPSPDGTPHVMKGMAMPLTVSPGR